MKKQLRTLTKLLAAVIACCLSVAVHAQTTVRGTVTDADGMPLVGATVIVITGTQPGGGTTTDANGKFAIAAAPGQRLSVSYIGYKETSVEVTTRPITTSGSKATMRRSTKSSSWATAPRKR